ncbi:MAG: lipid-A-disaccharide synthase [Candidatus Caenarcaniphilales bacterium]|nr:lipid-A-disaccharide synthase [Candidatus Caenarcaniphilales bacterium]
MLNIFISAGEASGDLYGSLILDELKKHIGVNPWGMGGQKLKASGLELVQDSSQLGVIGIVDLIKNLFFFQALERRLIEEIKRRSPQIALLIDYPGLNLRLAEAIKKQVPDCKVIGFVAPQVWAWHHSRIHKLPGLIDRLLVILPFEESLHQGAGTSTKFVGNPSAWFMSQVPMLNRKSYLQELGLNLHQPVIGIFPGSRNREISLMLPVMLKSAQSLKARIPEVQFLLVKAETITQAQIDQQIAASKISKDLIKQVDGIQNHQVLRSVDLAWLTSGTVTLEAACAGVPLMLGYRENPILFQIFRWLSLTPYIGLPNIIAGREIAPELVQEKCTVEDWVSLSENWLSDRTLLTKQKQKIKDALIILMQNPTNPFEKSAQEILSIAQIEQ